MVYEAIYGLGDKLEAGSPLKELAAVVTVYMVLGQKINAIKAIRRVTGVGLKEAKEAYEDTKEDIDRAIDFGDANLVVDSTDHILGNVESGLQRALGDYTVTLIASLKRQLADLERVNDDLRRRLA